MLTTFFSIRQDNITSCAVEFIKLLGVKVSASSIEKTLLGHQDYPSLLSASDMLNSYGLSHVAVRISKEELCTINTPFITQIKYAEGENYLFTVVEPVKGESIRYYDSRKGRWRSENLSFITNMFSGVILLGTSLDNAGERDYRNKLKVEKDRKKRVFVSVSFLPMITILSLVLAFIYHGWIALIPALYLLLTFSGMIASYLLVWYEVDRYNSLLNNICTLNRKPGCHAILTSKAAKIYGIGWSEIGFFFFTGSLVSQITSGVGNLNTLYILSCVNMFSLLYVFYSIFYQWRVARIWCPLCLFIQGILASQFLISYSSGWLHFSFSLITIINEGVNVLLFYLLSFLIVTLLLPVFKYKKEALQQRSQLQRLKHSSLVFSSLLSNERSILENSTGIGITLGNRKATNTIVKVCNPYCSGCSEAHASISDLLLHNSNLKVQIIFSVKDRDDDPRFNIVAHFLSLFHNEREEVFCQALDEWYLGGKKDYKTFSEKYKLSEPLSVQKARISDMSNWCLNNKITYTPTIFVNDKRIPDAYSVEDLKYLLV